MDVKYILQVLTVLKAYLQRWLPSILCLSVHSCNSLNGRCNIFCQPLQSAPTCDFCASFEPWQFLLLASGWPEHCVRSPGYSTGDRDRMRSVWNQMWVGRALPGVLLGVAFRWLQSSPTIIQLQSHKRLQTRTIFLWPVSSQAVSEKLFQATKFWIGVCYFTIDNWDAELLTYSPLKCSKTEDFEIIKVLPSLQVSHLSPI